MAATICLALIVLGVTAYAVLGGADFGAGLWDLTAGGARRGSRVRALIERSMSPVWEANHVWLIFVLVIFWTAFPVAFGSVASTLRVPLALAAIGIIFRGGAFALRGEAATINEARTLGALFALSSVIVPFCLGAAIGGVASGRVPVGNAAGDAWSSWLNPSSITVGVLAVLSGAYLSAVFMAADAVRAELPDMRAAMRTRALAAGAAAGVAALGGLLVLRADARPLFDGLTSWPGVVAIAVSALAGAAGLALVWLRRYHAARWVAALALAAVTSGWLVAQRPYLLPGQLKVAAAAAPDATLWLLIGAAAVGMAVLIPSLFLLYRLTLRGTLDKPFSPFDERYPKEAR